MSEKSQLKSGIVLSYINLIVGNILPMLYTPIMLRMLGQNEYGLYSLATSVTGYLYLMNLGIGSAVVRYLVKFRTQNDTDGECKMMGLFSCIFYIISILTFVIGVIIAFNVDLIYGSSLTASELEKMEILTVLISLNTALTFAFSVYGAVIAAHERFVFQQILNIITTILPTLVNLPLLFLGFKSIGIVISGLFLSSLAFVIKILYCRKILHIKPIYHNMPFHMLGELLTFSAYIFIGQIANTLYGATDKIVIGMFIGTAATAVYNIGLTFRNIIESISTAASSLLVPKVTSIVDSNANNEELTNIFIKVGRLQFILVGLVVGGFIAFGREFIVIFAGNEYSESYYVAVLLIIPMIIPLIQNVGISIITAMNKHRFRSVVNIIVAVLNVISTVILVQYRGVIGAAFTTFCTGFIGSVFMMNWYYHKKIHLNIPLFWKNIIKMAWVPICLTIITLILSRYFDFSNPVIMIIGIAIYTILYAALIYPTMNEYERGMIKNLLGKFKRSTV